MATPNKDDSLTFRLPSKTKSGFIKVCDEYEIRWPELLREVVDAAIEKRLVINVPQDRGRLIIGLHNPTIKPTN